MTPKTHPLLLPELVRLVLRNFNGRDNKFELTRCARVNKLWADEAIAVLWESNYGCRNLEHFFLKLSPKRRAYYASKVAALFLHERHLEVLRNHKLRQPLQWPYLKSLLVRGNRYCNYDELVLQFLGATLQSLSLENGNCYDKTMHMLPARCPRLSMISLYRLPDITPKAFLKVLEALPSITAIILYSMHHILTTEVLYHLANRDGLRHLWLRESLVEWWATPSSTWASSSPFSQLVDLSLRAQSSVFTGLFSFLQELETLTIKCLDVTEDLLLHVAHCSKLMRLDIEFAPDSCITGAHLVNLAERCRGLRRLILRGHDESKIKTNDLTDVHLERVASLLPNLTDFALRVGSESTGISVKSWISFGRHCRNLEIFGINRDFLEDMSQEGICLFPKVEELYVGEAFRYTGAPDADIEAAIGPVLRYHFPSLRSVVSLSGNIFYWIKP